MEGDIEIFVFSQGLLDADGNNMDVVETEKRVAL